MSAVDVITDTCQDGGDGGEIEINPSRTGDPQAAVSRPCPNPACKDGQVTDHGDLDARMTKGLADQDAFYRDHDRTIEAVDEHPCDHCNGHGEIELHGFDGLDWGDCAACGGTGVQA